MYPSYLVKAVTDFLFLGSKITVSGDYSHEIQRCLSLGRKAMTKLDTVLKCRIFTFLTKVCIVKAMAFPVVMYGYESWTIKKDECRRIDTFELWCWLRGIKLVNPKGNQPWIFIERTNAEAEARILQPLDANSSLIGKAPGTGKDWSWKEKGMAEDEIIRWHDWHMDMNLSKLQEVVEGKRAWCAIV